MANFYSGWLAPPNGFAKYRLRLAVWIAEQNVDANTSTVAWQTMLEKNRSQNGFYGYAAAFSTTINGTFVMDQTVTMPNAPWAGWSSWTLGSGTIVVPHDADGTKMITVAGAYVGANRGWAIGTVALVGDLTMVLPPIARATQPSVSPSPATVGSTVTIDLPRASTGFTHDLTWVSGNLSGTIATGVATTQTWTVPDVMGEFPGRVTAPITITAVTKSGATTVGTKQITLLARAAPAAPVPWVYDETRHFDIRAREVTWTGGHWVTGRELPVSSMQLVDPSSATATCKLVLSGLSDADFPDYSIVDVDIFDGSNWIFTNHRFVLTRVEGDSVDPTQTWTHSGTEFVDFELGFAYVPVDYIWDGTPGHSNPSAPGEMMRYAIADAQSWGWGPRIGVTFDGWGTSLGDGWANPSVKRIISKGTPLSQMLSELVEEGLVEYRVAYNADKAWLNLYNPGTGSSFTDAQSAPYVDLSLAPLTRAPRRASVEKRLTRVTVTATVPGSGTVKDKNKVEPRDIVVTRSKAAFDADVFGQMGGWVNATDITTDAAAAAIGDNALRDNQSPVDERTFEYDTAGTPSHFYPYSIFIPGDWLAVPSGTGSVKDRISQVTINKDAEGTISVTVLTGDRILSGTASLAKRQNAQTGSAIGGGTKAPAALLDSLIPAAPTVDTVTSLGYWDRDGAAKSAITVSWAAVTQAINSVPIDVDLYEVWERPSGTGEEWVRAGSTDGLSLILSVHEVNKAFDLRVRAESAAGTYGEFSEDQEHFTQAPKMDLVGPVMSDLYTDGVGSIYAVWGGQLGDEAGTDTPPTGTVVNTNVVTNPSFEAVTTGTTVMRTNLALNPNGAGASGFSSNNGAYNTATRNVPITGHPQGITTAAKATMTPGHPVTSGLLSMYNIDSLSNVNPARRLGAWFWVSSSGYQARLGVGAEPFTDLPAQTWVFLTDTLGLAANTYSGAYTQKIDGSTPPDTDYAYITGVTAFAGEAPTESLWGDRPDALGWDYSWTGTANASTSVAKASAVTVRTNLFTNPDSVGGAEGAAIPGWQTGVTRKSGLAIAASGGYSNNFTTSPGQIVGTRIRLLSAGGGTVSVQARETKATSFGGQPTIQSTLVTLVAGVTQEVTAGGTVTGVDTDGWRILFAGTTLTDLQVLATHVEAGNPAPLSIFSGSTPAAGDFSYAWTGTANASTSIQRAPAVAGVLSYSGAAGYLSGEWKKSGSRSLRITSAGIGTAGNSAVQIPTVFTAGKTYTFLATMHMDAPQVSPGAIARCLRLTGAAVFNGPQLPNVAGDQEYRWTVTIGVTAPTVFQLWNGTYPGDSDVWWDDLTIIEGDYEGAAFHGSTVSGNGYTYQWLGAADASQSVQMLGGPVSGDIWYESGPSGETIAAHVYDGTAWTLLPNIPTPARLAYVAGELSSDGGTIYTTAGTPISAAGTIIINPGAWGDFMVRLRAYDRLGNPGIPSAAQSITLIDPHISPSRPAAPTGLTVTPGAGWDASGFLPEAWFDLAWAVPTLDTAGAPISIVGYDVLGLRGGETIERFLTATGTNGVRVKVGNGETWSFRVVASSNFGGVSDPSSVVTATANATISVASAPTAPTLDQYAGLLRIKWAGGGMVPQIKYVYATISTTVGGTYTRAGMPLLGAGEIVVPGLAPGDYYAKIVMVDEMGNSSTSAASAKLTLLPITGVTIQTSAVANTGIKMTSGALTAYDVSGNPTFILNAATGEVWIAPYDAVFDLGASGTVATTGSATTGIAVSSDNSSFNTFIHPSGLQIRNDQTALSWWEADATDANLVNFFSPRAVIGQRMQVGDYEMLREAKSVGSRLVVRYKGA